MDIGEQNTNALQAHQNLKDLFDTIPEMMGMLSGIEHRFEYVNKSYTYFFGPTSAQTTATEAHVTCPEILTIIGSVYESGVSAALKEHPIQTLHGWRFFDLTFSARKNFEHRIDGVVFLGTDATQRVLERKKLEENETRLRQAIRAAKLGFWEYDIASDTLVWSSEVMEQWGVFKNSGCKADVYERIYPEDAPLLKQKFEEAVFAGKRYQIEHRIVRDDGQIIWIESQGDCVFSGKTVVSITGTSLDITERKHSEAQLLLAKEAAENANAAKSKFLAGVSHEIRNPLGAISGFVKLLKNPELTSLTLKKYISIIERNSEQLLKLVDDILDLSKVEAGKMSVEKLEIDLPEFLYELTSLMKLRARDKNLWFELLTQSALPKTIISDPTRLRQILGNMIGNAIKFTEMGSVVLEVSLHQSQLHFTVVDTGLGISSEQKNKIFSPFSQAESSTSRKYGGTGLGLILTRKLCEMLEGHFELVSSEIRQGSKFLASMKIEIPSGTPWVAPSEFSVGSNPTLSPKAHELKLKDMHILVVEDSVDNRELLEILLTEAGAQVELANDGNEGVKKAMSNAYHAVLMDIQMPKMDGHEAAQRLRKQGYLAPIIALTGHAMKEEEEKCMISGFTHFLTKPIQHENMILTLESLKTPPSHPRANISEIARSNLFH